MFDAEELAADLQRNIIPGVPRHQARRPLMTKGGGGSIVCISSDAAKIPWPFLATYNTSKGGRGRSGQGRRLELAHLKIRVNAVRPGLVQTEATKTGSVRQRGGDGGVPGRKTPAPHGIPDDIGAAVRYLAGPESSWVTGQSLGVEGGNELTRAPYLEFLVRKRFGDEAISAALAGQIPG